jgi:elongation factor P
VQSLQSTSGLEIEPATGASGPQSWLAKSFRPVTYPSLCQNYSYRQRGVIHLAIDTSDFKNGMHIYLDGEVYTIIEFQHVKPGKGGAFVRTRMRKVKTGSNLEKTFRAGEKVEPAFVEKKKLQFLYRQGSDLVLMDLDTYEQEPVPESAFGGQGKYLKEDMEITALDAGGEVLGYEVPNSVELQVVETDPGYRGDTVSGSSTKPAKLESGATINVPFHINEGDYVKVDTRTDTYLERVKK